MTDKRESPGRNAVATEHNFELSREPQMASSFRNEHPDDSKQTDSEGGRQTELRALREALWEAINGIEEKAPGAPIERELIILDHLAEGLENIMYEAQADSMRRGLQERKMK
jgi:hypothetical protein